MRTWVACLLAVTTWCSTRSNAQTSVSWNEEAVRAMVERGALDEAMSACDAAISNAFQEGLDQDRPLLDAIDASSLRFEILDVQGADLDRRLDCLRTWAQLQVNAEWQGMIDLDGVNGFKFGPEWTPWRLAQYRSRFGRGLLDSDDLDVVQDGMRLRFEAALEFGDVARMRHARRPDHPEMLVLVHDANMTIADCLKRDPSGVDATLLRATREDLFAIVNDLASSGLLDLWAGSEDSFAQGDASLGLLAENRLRDQPVDEFLVSSVTRWLESVPDDMWRQSPGWGLVGAARNIISEALRSEEPVPGVDRLAEVLVRILGIRPDVSPDNLGSSRFLLVSALVRAGRVDEAEAMFERLPQNTTGMERWARQGAVSDLRKVRGRSLSRRPAPAPEPLPESEPAADAGEAETASEIKEREDPPKAEGEVEGVMPRPRSSVAETAGVRTDSASRSGDWKLLLPVGLIVSVLILLGWSTLRRPAA